MDIPDGFQFTYIPNTNSAYETGIAYGERFGVVSVHDTPNPFKPGEHMLRINAWEVGNTGRPVLVDGARIAIPEYIIPVPSDQFTTHTAQDEIHVAAWKLGARMGVMPPFVSPVANVPDDMARIDS